GCLYDDRALATDPGDDRGPIFVIMAPARLAFLPTATWLASQRLLPALFCLPLVAGGVIVVIGFHHTFPLALPFIGPGRHCAATNTTDSRCGHGPPTLWQCDERNTTDTTEKWRESSAS